MTGGGGGERNGYAAGRRRRHYMPHPHRPTESEISCFVKFVPLSFTPSLRLKLRPD